MAKNEGRIGILGGTFDPVHNGHVALGKAAIRQGSLRKLIVMPAKVQPFKLGREITEDVHRLEMCRRAFAGDERMEVSDYEMIHTSISYTYDTLAYLKTIYPDDELFFIMGTDSFLELESWYKGVDLLENFSFMVSVRPGYREEDLQRKIQEYRQHYQADVIEITEEMPDISSTTIKARLSRDCSVRDMIPAAVERYIYEHKLYS